MKVFSRQSKETPRRRRSEAAKQPTSETPVSFRRNRTLTGSRSQQVAAAGSDKHNELLSPRAQAHQLAQHRRRLGMIFVAVAGVCVLFSVLLYQFTATARVVSGTDVQLDTASYAASIDEYLRQHPAERLRVTLDEQRLLVHLQRIHPEVTAVAVAGFAGIGESNFELSVRRPIAAWQIEDELYFVDATGVAFKKNYFDTPTVRIVDESAAVQPGDAAVASSRFLSFVGRAAAYAQSVGVTIDTATIPWGTTRQLELRLEEKDYPVRVSLDRPVGEQFEDAMRSIAYLEEKRVQPEYIDVRVSGKAFYK